MRLECMDEVGALYEVIQDVVYASEPTSTEYVVRKVLAFLTSDAFVDEFRRQVQTSPAVAPLLAAPVTSYPDGAGAPIPFIAVDAFDVELMERIESALRPAIAHLPDTLFVGGPRSE